MAIPISVIGDEGMVDRNVAAEFSHRVQQPFNRVEIAHQPIL